MTKKTKKTYNNISISRIASVNISEDGSSFDIEGVTESGESKRYPCSLELYKVVESSDVKSKYRLNFNFHIDKDTGILERITASPKTEYQAYTIEYESEINLPKNKLFSKPT